eukprot:SAG11_NODE_5415_length_1566_cov_2.510566_2_plen_119_part_00
MAHQAHIKLAVRPALPPNHSASGSVPQHLPRCDDADLFSCQVGTLKKAQAAEARHADADDDQEAEEYRLQAVAHYTEGQQQLFKAARAAGVGTPTAKKLRAKAQVRTLQAPALRRHLS